MLTLLVENGRVWHWRKAFSENYQEKINTQPTVIWDKAPIAKIAAGPRHVLLIGGTHFGPILAH
jgi:hypothetical protein